MVTHDCFAEYVKEALSDFYNPVRMRTNPLIQSFGLQESEGEAAPITLRRVLREAIESLRPPATIPFADPAWLGYRVLWLRYIQARSRLATCDEMGLSQASYYRHQQLAIEALVAILWAKHQAFVRADEALQPSVPEPHELATEEAAKLARESPQQPVNVVEVLRTAEQMLQPLAERRSVTLGIHVPPDLPAIHADPALIRQVVLNLLTAGLEFAAHGALDLTASVHGSEVMISLRELVGPAGEPAPDQPEGFRVSRSLVEAFGGRFWSAPTPNGGLALCLTIPIPEPCTILVVDDDGDTTRLYRRYLEGYRICVAHSAEEVRAVLQETRPQLILLDVLMPEQDGWDIVRYLKASPALECIPVVICSVLSQPQLALAMGAAQVLHKPIDQRTLLRTIKTVLAGADTGG